MRRVRLQDPPDCLRVRVKPRGSGGSKDERPHKRSRVVLLVRPPSENEGDTRRRDGEEALKIQEPWNWDAHGQGPVWVREGPQEAVDRSDPWIT